MSIFIDTDAILSCSEQWQNLEQQWGTPVDLDTEEEDPGMKAVFSTLDLLKSTFDSSLLLKKVKRELAKKTVNYADFLRGLHKTARNPAEKDFYFISGQILSAASVEDICDDIDDIFGSVNRLYSATSTVRDSRPRQKPVLTEVVTCSFAASGLSFDDTVVDIAEKEKGDSDDVDRYIDEVFGQINDTLASLSRDDLDETLKDSVTTLVRKFSAVLKNPGLKCSPRKRRECCDRFKDLAVFWQSQIVDTNSVRL